MILFNKNIKASLIRPTSFRMSVVPVNIRLTAPESLYLPNSAITDNVTTGGYAAIISDTSLTGSLMTGVSGSVLTAFTILIKAKPQSGGAPTQTLFHRRLGDKSLSSLGATLASPGFDDRIVLYKYGDLLAISAVTNCATTNVVTPAPLILDFGTFTQTTQQSTGDYYKSFSGTITATIVGGGILNWNATKTTAAFTTSWLSLCASTVAGTISSSNNLASQSAFITAYIDKSATGYLAFGILNNTTLTNHHIILNSSDYSSGVNLPLNISCKLSVVTPA